MEKDVLRWTAKRKVELLLQLIKGEAEVGARGRSALPEDRAWPRAAHATVQQRTCLWREALRRRRASLWPGAGVHHALHARAGRDDRTLLTLKQECVWLHRFESRDHTFRVVDDWLDRYDADRPHSALGYLTPKAYREKLAA